MNVLVLLLLLLAVATPALLLEAPPPAPAGHGTPVGSSHDGSRATGSQPGV
jgi:hypothetical protein